MRCLVHDFAGYAFAIQLSRELVRRGNDVTYVYAGGLEGPKGQLESSPFETGHLAIQAVPLSGYFSKYSPVRRLAAHRSYAQSIKALISSGRFDVVLSGNTPIDVQAEIVWHCRRNGVGFVHWVQDVYSLAIGFLLHTRFSGPAAWLKVPFQLLEEKVCSASDGIIVIAPEFRDRLMQWGVPSPKVSVIENWGPLDEIESLPRVNPWSDRHGLNDSTVFLYSGTLGYKHRPDLLYSLAQSLGSTCKVVVITEGVGRERLEKLPKLDNLLLLDFQTYAEMPQALASADVLLATLDAAAGVFAVPSKVLSYFCAGRPVLLAAPADNLSASVLHRSGGGIVVDPGRTGDWIAAAKSLANDPALRACLGRRARRYAEATFDISRIACTFEEVLLRACTVGTAV
jgi:colanic acid biosynthesis glycosyl transferase WcaI